MYSCDSPLPPLLLPLRSGSHPAPLVGLFLPSQLVRLCLLCLVFLFSLVSCPFFPLSTVYVSPKSSHTTCSSLHTNLDLPCGHDLSVSSAFWYCPLSSQLPQITSDHLVLLRSSSFSPFISHYSLDHFPGSSPAFVHRHCTGQLPFVLLSIRLSTCFLASWRLPVAHPHYSLTVLDQILSPSLPSSSAFSSSCLGLLSSLSPSAPLPLPSLVLILHFTPFGSLDNHLPYKLIISFKIAFIFPQPLSSLPASVRRLNQPQRVIISRLTTGHFEPVTPNGLGLPFSSPSSTCDLLPGHVLSKLTSSKFNLFIYIYIYIYNSFFHFLIYLKSSINLTSKYYLYTTHKVSFIHLIILLIGILLPSTRVPQVIICLNHSSPGLI